MAVESVLASWQDIEAEFEKLLKEVSRRDPDSLTGLEGLDEYFQNCPEAAQECYIELIKTCGLSPERDSQSTQSSGESETPSIIDEPTF